MRDRWIIAAAVLATATACATEQPAPHEESAPAAESMPAPGTPEARIREAMSAAPASIAADATIMDWPATEGGAPTELRAGTNGWTCFPSSPAAVTAAEEDPMCLDDAWLALVNAWAAKTPPVLTKMGIGYMLQGDAGSSVTDPFATAATVDNQWHVTPPHLMIAVPDVAMLAGLSVRPDGGGPYVMWSGTPWAHIMVPVAPHR